MSKKTKGRLTRDGATVRRVQVMLDDATIERAKLLGKGNISQGIREALKRAPVWINRRQATRLRHVARVRDGYAPKHRF